MFFMLNMPQFTEEDDEQLIEAIKCCPEIYNKQHKNFKNISVKENIWDDIAGGIGKDVISCKKRWRDIRDNFFKIKRRQKLGTGSTAPIKWPLFDILSFLNNVNIEKRERKSFSNISNASTDEETQNHSNTEDDTNSLFTSSEANIDSCSSFHTEVVFATMQNSDENTKRGKKRKQIDILQENSERRVQLLAKKKREDDDDDDVDLFMKSIAQTVKKFPVHLIAQAKMDILKTVTKLQLTTELGRIK